MTAAVCAPACRNGGTCSSPNVCSCRSGWTGSICNQRKLICFIVIVLILLFLKLFAHLRVQMAELVLDPIPALAVVDGLD